MLLFSLPVLSCVINGSHSLLDNNLNLRTSSSANFYAISESDLTTRWILQDNELTPVENFTDDINSDAWSLIGATEDNLNISTQTQQDAYTWAKYTGQNYGSSDTVIIGQYLSEYLYGFLKWETGYLTTNITANSTIYAYGFSVGGIPEVNISATSNFQESTITWSNMPATGSFLSSYTGTEGSGVWTNIDLGEVYSDYYKMIGVADGKYFQFASKSWSVVEERPTMRHYLSKIYFGSGYMYAQTNEIEDIGLQSIDYTTHYNLSSGDYFEVDFQTSSDSQINLILLKDGVVNKSLILSPSGNTNFNRHTAQISVDEFVEFDQLIINSTFEDKDLKLTNTHL